MADKNLGGRPETEFDLTEVRKLAEVGLTQAEIAYIIGIAPETLSRNKKKNEKLRQVIEEGRAIDKNELIKKMRNLTEKGNNKYNAIKYLLSSLHGLSETNKLDLTSLGEKIEPTTFVVMGKDKED